MIIAGANGKDLHDRGQNGRVDRSPARRRLKGCPRAGIGNPC